MTATETYVAENSCTECGYEEVVVERGGGVVSVSCPACGFAASAKEEEVASELGEFLETVAQMPPEERRWVILGAVAGVLKAIPFFFLAIFLNAADGGGKGIGR